MSQELEFITERVFDAPRDLVFKMFTEIEHMKKWLGPKGFTMDYKVADVRPGGETFVKEITQDGHVSWGRAIYREIVKPSKIVYEQCFADEKGNAIRHPLSDTWPLWMKTTILLEEQGNKTKLTLKWLPINANEEEINTFIGAKPGMSQGWAGTFEQLDVYLKELASV